MATFRAELSPHEDATLRRIAAGTANPQEVREADTKRLIALGLVQKIDGKLIATKVGLDRSNGLKRFDTRQEPQQRLRTTKSPSARNRARRRRMSG
jgi:hypothetical protein